MLDNLRIDLDHTSSISLTLIWPNSLKINTYTLAYVNTILTIIGCNMKRGKYANTHHRGTFHNRN